MKLENLNLHLENLLPGIVILSGILMLIPSSSDSISLMVDLRTVRVPSLSPIPDSIILARLNIRRHFACDLGRFI